MYLVGPDANCTYIDLNSCRCRKAQASPLSTNQQPSSRGDHQRYTCASSFRFEELPSIHQYTDKVNLRIIVITFDRADSLSKTLQSLHGLELDGHTASVEIWLDRSKDGKLHCATLAVALEFCWEHGPVTVHIQQTHRGLVGKYNAK